MKKLNTLLLTLTITANVFAQIDKQPDTLKVIDLDQVVVTGQYKPQSVKNSVYQVRIINNETIKATGAANIQQVLITQLGFRFSQDNTLGTSDVQLQGMSGRNVKILLDGVPMVDRGDTRESLNQVDINTIERIEIIEGPMSVSYGSDALAGVINIITKKNVKHQFTLSAKVQDETVGSEYHPFYYKGQHTQHLDLQWMKKRWNFSAGATHQEFDGLGGDVYGRDKPWLPKEQWLGHFKTGYTRDRFNIYYRLDGLQEWIKDRGPINTNTYKAIDKKYFTNRFMHQLQGNWSFNNSIQWSSVLAFTNYERETITTRHDFEKDIDEKTTGEGEQDISKFNSLVFRNTLFYKINSKLSLQPGIDINREEANGARITGAPVITDYALFVSAELKPLEKINIRPGLRFIKNSIYDAPPVVPSLNAKFSLSEKADLRLAYTYGFRSPALRELYFEFRDANHQIIGNPDLEAEHSNSFSGAFNYAFLQTGKSKLSTKATVFYNEFRNLINYAQTAADLNLYMYVNIDKFKTTGFSWETNLNLARFSAILGFSYIGRYNQFVDDPVFKQEELPSFTWSPELNSNLLYSWDKIGATIGVFYKFTGIRPGYQLFFNSTTGADELHQTKIESFHWADITFSKKLFNYFTATAGIKNIFGVTNLANTSTAAGSVHGSGGPVPMGYGRSYFFGLAFQFTKK